MSDINDIAIGKVNAIMPFGAFVQLEDGSSGLVHISEISEEFVKNVGDLLHMGQTVKVLCMGTEHDGMSSSSFFPLGLVPARGKVCSMPSSSFTRVSGEAPATSTSIPEK